MIRSKPILCLALLLPFASCTCQYGYYQRPGYGYGYPQNGYPYGYPQNGYPPGAYPNGYPPNGYPPGAYPAGGYPPGAYPGGGYPNGQVVVGPDPRQEAMERAQRDQRDREIRREREMQGSDPWAGRPGEVMHPRAQPGYPDQSGPGRMGSGPVSEPWGGPGISSGPVSAPGRMGSGPASAPAGGPASAPNPGPGDDSYVRAREQENRGPVQGAGNVGAPVTNAPARRAPMGH